MDHSEIAEQALDITLPSIKKLLSEKAKRKDMHIVVMNPTVKPWEASFAEAILIEKSLSDPAGWENPYDTFARLKAKQAWMDGVSNMHKQLISPATLKNGDVAFFGSFVYEGVVVAASGVEPWFDVLVSAWIATAIQQLAMNELAKFRGSNPKAALIF